MKNLIKPDIGLTKPQKKGDENAKKMLFYYL